MWGGKKFRPGDHIGNVKIGPAGTRCPEDAKVSVPVVCNRNCVYLLAAIIYF